MSRLLDACETIISPGYRLLGLFDTSVDTYQPHTDPANWLLFAPGMVYLQVPSQVIETSIRLESWSNAPPEDTGEWSGKEEVEVEIPVGELALEIIAGGFKPIPLILPSPGLYRMRWKWVFNPERGPFISPLAGRQDTLPTLPGREEELNGKDQYCLVQIWRVAAGNKSGCSAGEPG
ncbi:hypothetical protein QQY66_33390 [Streptomyces sp. DG2A-72]|uniref:hypothetical protein n=1 Tax=Streptomyces sp. DG2A-72 TaxID=3051386 RepID=UPI00265B92C5|nr:hypothetical protein [Streptomyces sp. DG2A-72]MDO0936357.1 hypothetical protein [Streptomyces sp. DG2A-72]